MFEVGTRVRLLHPLGRHAAGATGVVVESRGKECVVEFDDGSRLLVACATLSREPLRT